MLNLFLHMDPLEKINEKLTELEGKATELKETLEAADAGSDEAKDVKASLEKVTERLETLEGEKALAEAEADKKAMQERIEQLEKRFETARKPGATFALGVPTNGSEDDSPYGENGAHSFYGDVKAARGGDRQAWERLEEVTEGKAMGEGAGSTGGFTVPTEISSELIRFREAGGILRSLFSQQPIGTTELEVSALDNGLAVAWTAEFAEKIKSDLGFSQFTVNVFTAAGLAVASNQLLADSRFSIDSLINADFAKRFVALEEIAFLNGSGTNQPRGIRNTAGVDSIPLTSTSVVDLLDAITDAITEVYSTYFGAPDAIVMHPKTWGRIVKARETTSPSTYLIGAGSTAFGRRGNDALPGYGSGPLPRGDLFGVNVYTTPNVPTDLGDDSNESAVFIGNFSEGLVLDRQGITTDQSEHVYFTSNQTVFRSEERVGFTAARYPTAFKVIEGAGLAAG